MGVQTPWLEKAQESSKAAHACLAAGCIRSSVSRSYYAAYQAATAVLDCSGQLTPPTVAGQLRESWPHEATPYLVKTHLKKMMRQDHMRTQMASRLGELYKMRVDADYLSDAVISDAQARYARRIAGMIVKLADDVIGG